MNKANECTCPSGDGSLVHPCPAHPAVEQAGGDERAAFERAFTVQEGIYFDDKRSEYRSMNLRAIEATDAQDLNLRLQGWQARAALAQPSPLQAEQPTADDYEEVLADHRRLVRELDVLLNGEDGAARQASLCDLVAQVRAVRQTHDENVPADNLGQSLLMLEFALMFALCNFQHAGSRNDVKKAQTRLQEVLRFLSGKAKGFHLNTTELGYCAENPDVLRALAYEHDARAAATEAIDLSGAVNTHEARAAVLRAEAKRIEDEL
ncbi:hypothetical protein N0681_23015 [Pseudomonas aeruginosa]|uniref:hypothetical protein n=1 Tax=Pseudomonas aeruginosa TaxID=287 RepID=UPI0019119FBA|nr:hypothetical protein [Pseudomonas aeruginosa]MCT0738661.1 hypothetical protein [Pseudomonas aeruginosa]MCT0744569.1 hypothetical protein [Pseudomonas aeruginosa]MCT0763465.1 hypothetical protein [Pseudomonas aeruginosa]MCT0781090.1 hypothetical protein [Pseudomonas aeruginosa]MCT0800052.1 hypothetical protein [Pseudomonas aeruginosa]